jgi:hypothetical protein
MSSGCNNSYNEGTGLVHHTDYDDEGRHSFDYDPLTGDITHDHSVSNENQDEKIQWPDSNIWDELENESK